MKYLYLFLLILLCGCTTDNARELANESAKPKFSLGQLVYHKSNSDIKLLVTNIYSDRYLCAWIDNVGEPQSGNYYEYELEKVKE